jgi:hypothetical protein
MSGERDDASGLARPPLSHIVICVAMAIGFVAVFSHTPMTVYANAIHDDALFIRLGSQLAHLKWLGKYDQMILAKGPGYPIFLAINSWLGLPVSAGHAIFHCIASGLFGWVCSRASGSRWLGVAVLSVLLWNPLFLTARVVREAIYTGQILFVYGLAFYSLFLARTPRGGIVGAALTGFFLGWCWLTREEGLLLFPGLAILLLVAVVRHMRQANQLRLLAVVLSSMVVTFLGVQAGFRLTNLAQYGSPVGVDFKEANFIAAVQALQSVKVGQPMAFLPVPRAVRERVYEVSPAFASLRGYLDPPTGSPWQFGCEYWKWTCGDIASGWFVWALRDAAAATGQYRSPAAASNFFLTLSRQVNEACQAGKLTCEHSWVPYMPRVTGEQFSSIPTWLTKAIRLIAHVDPLPMDVQPSVGNPRDMAEALAFLNYPICSDLPTGGQEDRTLEGWFFDGTAGWFSLEIRSSSEGDAYASIERKDSPDLVSAFNNPAAARHRFSIEARCKTDCRLVFVSDRNERREVNLNEVLQGVRAFQIGEGMIQLDDVLDAKSTHIPAGDPVLKRSAAQIRRFLDRMFGLILPTFMFTGTAAVLVLAIAAIPGRNRRLLPVVTVLAGSLWTFVLVRAFALALISISAFPAVNHLYLGSAVYVAPVAALLSLWAAIVTYGPSLRSKVFKPRKDART